MTRLRVLAVGCAFVLMTGSFQLLRADPTVPAERQKIEALITHVAELKETLFVRNGRAYDAPTAARFLRRKWEAYSSEVKTARDFIEKIASMSGTSGRPYLIRLKDGMELTSKDYLLAELEKLEDTKF